MLQARLHRFLLWVETALAGLTRWRRDHHQGVLERYFCDGSLSSAEHGQRALVVYAGTIGEFHAVASFITAYFERWPDDRLIVLMGRERYLQTVVESRKGSSAGLLNWRTPRLDDRFLHWARPRFLVLAEGPCLDGYFPIPFQLGLLSACLLRNLPVFVINACSYRKNISSPIDKVEHACFGSLHGKAVAQWYAPSEAMAERLAADGVPREKISVTGNMKFDAFRSSRTDATKPNREQRIADFAAYRTAPLMVGGNVNAIDEQEDLFRAWKQVRDHYPATRLVIAPRYLQFENVISDFRALLTAEGIRHGLWSAGAEANRESDVLIVDTYGDLSHFYGVADLCYAGRNHGVLEPLHRGKATMVSTNWLDSSGGFEVYRRLVEAGGLVAVSDQTDLGAVAKRLLEDDAFRKATIERANAVIAKEDGAGERTLQQLESWLKLKDGV